MAQDVSKKAPFFSQEKDEAAVARLREKFSTEEGRKQHKRGVQILFAVSLIVTLLLSLVNWGVVTGWGQVKVSRLTLSGTNGDKLSVLLYQPKSATQETPAPCVICYHGNAGNARNHESWATEFARRGFVVLTPDQYGAGNSDNSASELIDYESMFVNGFAVYDHVLTLDYVDHDNIFTAGHSMGGTTAYAVASQFDAKGVLIASNRFASHIAKREEPHYKALYEQIQGYVGDVIMIYGDVEKGINEEEMVNLSNGWIQAKQERGYAGYEGVTYTKTDEIIGSFENGDAFMASIDTARVHEAAFVTEETIGKLVGFAQQAADNVPNYIDPADQVWMAKDYLGFLGVLSFGVFICALALLLIEVIPFFNEVKRAPTRNIGLRGPGMAISLTLGVAFPFIALKTGGLGLIELLMPGASGPPDFVQGRAPFHMTYANISMGLVIALNLLGVLGFLLFFFTDGKKHGLQLCDLGLTESDSNKFSFKLVGKTLALSAIVVAIAWALLQLMEDVLGTTLYCWFFGFKAIPMNVVKYYWPYIIVWILCFTIASFTLNIERRLPSTGNDLLDTVLQMIINIVFATFTIILVIVLCWDNETYQMGLPAFLTSYTTDIAKIWGMPLGMTVGVGGSTLLYRNTHNTWLSAILMGTVSALMCVTYALLRIYG